MKKYIKIFVPLFLEIILGIGVYIYAREFVSWDDMPLLYSGAALILLSFAGICAFTGKTKKSIIGKAIGGLFGVAAILFGLTMVVNNVIMDGIRPDIAIAIVLTVILVLASGILVSYYINSKAYLKTITAFLLILLSAALGSIGVCGLWEEMISDSLYNITDKLDPDRISTAEFYIDAYVTGDVIPNIASVNNAWAMSGSADLVKNEKYDIYEFVEYVQFMACSGGEESRDLFVDPLDRTTMTDYAFTKLIESCRGLVNNGIKPWLKLGNVPLKFTTDPEIRGMGVNVYPPDDYNVYYDYIKAIAEALVEEFGLEEVKSWRFGCLTEFENDDWFAAKSGKSEDNKEAFLKLYDYTAQALIDVIGEDVFIGAHGIFFMQGTWDEMDFIKHCAEGTNYATGKKGTKLSYLGMSHYDTKPGEYTNGYTVPETMALMKKTAEKYGFTDLVYGVDEGRILEGNTPGVNDAALDPRIVGYTWQAAYDARLFKQAIDSGMDYISSWIYLSHGREKGYPSVSYHVLSNLAKFENSKSLSVKTSKEKLKYGVETECLAGYNEETKTLRLMAYNYRNQLEYSNDAQLSFTVNVPEFDGKTVTVTKYLINDDCNYFDEWLEDREKYNITDDYFSWSPDAINAVMIIDNENFKDKLNAEELHKKYEECSRLLPVTEEYTVENGIIELSATLGASNVVFYEIAEK